MNFSNFSFLLLCQIIKKNISHIHFLIDIFIFVFPGKFFFFFLILNSARKIKERINLFHIFFHLFFIHEYKINFQLSNTKTNNFQYEKDLHRYKLHTYKCSMFMVELVREFVLKRFFKLNFGD